MAYRRRLAGDRSHFRNSDGLLRAAPSGVRTYDYACRAGKGTARSGAIEDSSGIEAAGSCRPKVGGREILCDALEDSGGAHAAAYAHRNDAIARVAALEFPQDCRGEFCAGAAERMAERYGAAVDDLHARDRGPRFWFTPGPAPRMPRSIRLHRCLSSVRPASFSAFGIAIDGADAHFLGREACCGEGEEIAPWARCPVRGRVRRS